MASVLCACINMLIRQLLSQPKANPDPNLLPMGTRFLSPHSQEVTMRPRLIRHIAEIRGYPSASGLVYLAQQPDSSLGWSF